MRTGSSNEYRVNAATSLTGDTTNKMQTEVTILQSDTLILNVAREMNLANNPDFLGVKAPPRNANLNDPAVRQATVSRLRRSLKIAVVPKTDIITISYSSLNPKLSADIVNKVIDDYIQRSYTSRFASTQKVSEWLSDPTG